MEMDTYNKFVYMSDACVVMSYIVCFEQNV